MYKGFPFSLSQSAHRFINNSMAYLLLGMGMVFVLLPFLWMVSAAFKGPEEILTYPPRLWAREWTLDNFRYVFEKTQFGRFFANSFLLSTATIIGHLLSGSLAAFGFARLRFPGRNILFMVLLSTLMIPFYAYMIPRFMIMRWLDLLDSLTAVFLPYLFGGPFYIFLLRQYFMTFPRELDEATLIEGGSYLQLYWYVFLPLARPALISVGILEFLASWTSFLEPLIYLNTQDNFTVSLGLTLFRDGFGGVIQWGPLMAATVISALPPLIICFLAQKHLMGGIAFTGLRG